jgi:hypothetical protein
MKLNDSIYWTVTDGSTNIGAYQEDKGTLEESVNRLDECLDAITEGYVNVKISKRSNTDKSNGGDLKTVNANFRIHCKESDKPQHTCNSVKFLHYWCLTWIVSKFLGEFFEVLE